MTDMFYAVNLVYTNLIYFRVEKIMFILQYKTMIHQNLHPKKKTAQISWQTEKYRPNLSTN